jgi:hypothetical protein
VHEDSEGETGGMTTKRIADRAGLCKCRAVGGCCPQQTNGQDPKLGPCYRTRKEFAAKDSYCVGRAQTAGRAWCCEHKKKNGRQAELLSIPDDRA